MTSINKFDEEEFDRRVGNVITNIHSKQRHKVIAKKLNHWCKDNIEHLENLYYIADIDIDFDVFCYFVFVNSNV